MQDKLIDIAKLQCRVIYALLMHDIKTRFFGNGLGFIISVLWPFIHIICILLTFVFTGRTFPFGNSTVLFISTGVIPFISFSYISRFMAFGTLSNRSFLQYPIVKLNDLMISRAILEIVSCVAYTALLIIVLGVSGVEWIPLNPSQAAYALGACILLGIGMGYLNGVIAMIFPMWVTVYALSQIIFWATCGLVILPEFLPTQAAYAMSFNPVLHGVEWMRSAYYPGYGSKILNRSYIVEFGCLSFAIGLLGELALRDKLTSPR